MAQHNELGRLGEQQACRYLAEKGYSLLARNWRLGHLEIDIIADYFGEVVFVEVKTRSSEAIAEAVKGQITILVDGGIRSGMDVFKALALGADAVLIGRPFVNMVYGGGAEGVRVYVDKLKAELADTMAMCGAHSLAEIDRSMVR